MSEWQEIESAPKTGEMLIFKNEENGLTDVAYWCDYSWMPDECRNDWSEELRKDQGEWSSLKGNFPMTHWAYYPR